MLRDESRLPEFRQQLRSLYERQAPVTDSGKRGQSSTSIPSNFSSLFVRNELRTLYGTRKVNYFILFFLSVFSLLVLGFANGSLNYLDIKKHDTFVNWLTVKIPWTQSGKQFARIKEVLNDPANKKH